MIRCRLITINFGPVQAIKSYLFLRGPHTGYLYCHPAGQPVAKNEFTKVLTRALQYMCISRHTMYILSRIHHTVFGSDPPLMQQN